VGTKLAEEIDFEVLAEAKKWRVDPEITPRNLRLRIKYRWPTSGMSLIFLPIKGLLGVIPIPTIENL
jgi:hypothetical protein